MKYVNQNFFYFRQITKFLNSRCHETTVFYAIDKENNLSYGYEDDFLSCASGRTDDDSEDMTMVSLQCGYAGVCSGHIFCLCYMGSSYTENFCFRL